MNMNMIIILYGTQNMCIVNCKEHRGHYTLNSFGNVFSNVYCVKCVFRTVFRHRTMSYRHPEKDLALIRHRLYCELNVRGHRLLNGVDIRPVVVCLAYFRSIWHLAKMNLSNIDRYMDSENKFNHSGPFRPSLVA